MKDRATREKEDAGKVGRVEKQMVPLSLLQLTLPTQPTPTVNPETLPQPGQHTNQEGQPVTVSIAPATVTMAAAPQPIQAAVVVVGSMEQVGGWGVGGGGWIRGQFRFLNLIWL